MPSTVQNPPMTSSPLLGGTPVHPKFPKDNEFQVELHRRVEQHFAATGKFQRDCPRMYLKTGLILGSFLTSYVLLVFFSSSWMSALPLALVLAVSTAAIGFNIQHDAGHKAYSNVGWINKLMSWTIDIVGGSSYMWHWKHGVFHHTYTNISGHDNDIELGLLGRLSPHQPRYALHRWQHLYLWPLYGFVVIKWNLFDDFHSYVTGKIGENRYPRPKGWELVVFIAGKLIFFSLAFAIPMIFHAWWVVLLSYLMVAVVTGIILSVVFQLAHCDEQAQFPLPIEDTGRMQQAWAIHQVETTVDFAPRSRVLTWLLGGLNYQIEHHLFPKICHTNYPALSKIVRQTCHDFGIPYHVHLTFWGALKAHYRWLRRMGQPIPVLIRA